MMNKNEMVEFIRKHISGDRSELWSEFYVILDQYDDEEELFTELLKIVERHLIIEINYS